MIGWLFNEYQSIQFIFLQHFCHITLNLFLYFLDTNLKICIQRFYYEIIKNKVIHFLSEHI